MIFLKFTKFLTALFTASFIAAAVRLYRNWQRQALARLRTESTVIETRYGPIECRLRGSGPALLIAHGSPGGYDQGFAFAKLLLQYPQSGSNTRQFEDAYYKDQSTPSVGSVYRSAPKRSRNLAAGNLERTVIAVSRPGYLRTPLSSGETPEEQADLYAALLDELHISSATIIGISGGGPSAIQFSLRHPERCSGLVMVSGVAQHYSEEELRQAMPRLRRWIRRVYERVIIFDPLLYFLLPFAYLRPSLATADLLRSVTLYHLRKIGYDNDMAQFDAITHYPLEQISAPTFVVHGVDDDEVSFNDALLLAHSVPKVKLLAVKGAQHMAFYTHASLVMPEVRAFLSRGGID